MPKVKLWRDKPQESIDALNKAIKRAMVNYDIKTYEEISVLLGGSISSQTVRSRFKDGKWLCYEAAILINKLHMPPEDAALFLKVMVKQDERKKRQTQTAAAPCQR